MMLAMCVLGAVVFGVMFRGLRGLRAVRYAWVADELVHVAGMLRRDWDRNEPMMLAYVPVNDVLRAVCADGRYRVQWRRVDSLDQAALFVVGNEKQWRLASTVFREIARMVLKTGEDFGVAVQRVVALLKKYDMRAV